MNKEIKEYIDAAIKRALDERLGTTKDNQLMVVSSKAALAVVEREVLPKINELADRIDYATGNLLYDDYESYRRGVYEQDSYGTKRIESAQASKRRLGVGIELAREYDS